MKKYFLIAAILFFSCLQAICQNNEAFNIDSVKLRTLKKMLPSLKDSARVDMLNSIAGKTLLNAGGSPKDRIDTCLFYASIAYKEAVKLGYKPGIAKAMLQLAGTESGMNQHITDEAGKEKKMWQVLQMAEELNNDEIRGQVYGSLAWLPSTRNDFTRYEDYSKKAIYYLLKAKDTLGAAGTCNWLVGDYSARGEYEKAFDYAKKAVELSKKSGTDYSMSWQQFLVQFSLGGMSGLYSIAGDYETAMNYIKENARYGKDNKTGWDNFDGDFANLFCTMGKYDSALFYANRLSTYVPPGRFPGRSAVFGQIYLNGTKEYDKAISEFTRCRDTVIKYLTDSIYATARWLIYIGQAYDGKKNYETALQFAKQGVRLVEEKKQRPLMMEGYQALSCIYHHLGNNDSAYEYLLKYNTIKDSIQNKQFLLRMYNSKKEAENVRKEAQIGLLNKDNLIKNQQLKQEATFRNFLIALFIAIIFAGLYVFRNLTLKRKNERLQQDQKEQQWKLKELESENKHVELQRQSAELEMQALRAQMNPHFIFNSLSSINHFILKNESKTASNYLTRFSRLIRMVLINSQKPLITLQDELEMLRLYLDMERLRFKNSFDYVISFINEIDSENVFVPPLILQPFCENALWHGLMHKEGQGHLVIDLSMESNGLQCMITDDGVGREKAAELKSKSAEKEKSLGLQITTQRLALINQNSNIQTNYTIEDVLDENKTVAGTKVTLKISYNELIEEFV